MGANDAQVEVLVPLKSWEEVVTELQDLEVKLADAIARAEDAERRERHMLATLTQAQQRSTACLEIARACKFIGDDPIMQSLAPLGEACLRDAETYPEGRVFQLLIAAVGRLGGELAGDPDPKQRERVRAALLDVATAASRAWMHMGDV